MGNNTTCGYCFLLNSQCFDAVGKNIWPTESPAPTIYISGLLGN